MSKSTHLKKKGYTLAEVLITLGIIGIVAAMTIPGLITKNQRRAWGAMTKKVYSDLSQGARLYIAKHGEQVFYDMSPNCHDISDDYKNFCTYIQETFKGVTKCKNLEDCWGPLYIFNEREVENIHLPLNQYTSYVLINGTTINMQNGDDTFKFYIDVNGKRNPNKIGRDFFILKMKKNGTFTTRSWNGAECEYNYEVCLDQLMKNTLKYDN